MRRVEHCTHIVIAIAKPGYFSSRADTGVTTKLPSTLTLTNVSAALLHLHRLLTPQHAGSSLAQGQPPGRTDTRCYPHQMLKKNLLPVLPEIYTGFLPNLSDKGPNVILPISNPAKNRDDARLTL